MKTLIAVLILLIILPSAFGWSPWEKRRIWNGDRWFSVVAPPEATEIEMGDGRVYSLYDFKTCQLLVGPVNLFKAVPAKESHKK